MTQHVVLRWLFAPVGSPLAMDALATWFSEANTGYGQG